MPRVGRCYYQSKFYHIMVQGIEKNYIFNDDFLKKKYIQILKYFLKKEAIELIAYCIMDNHAHILIYTEKNEKMSKAMQKINSTYANLYNQVEKRVGYVFRNRFKSQEIISQQHLYNCINYIHQNPIKAKVVKNVGDYLYSSYQEFDINMKASIINKMIDEELNISNNLNEEFFEDIKEENNDVYDFLKNRNIELSQLLQKRELLNELIVYMRKKGNSIRKIANQLNVNREIVRKIK